MRSHAERGNEFIPDSIALHPGYACYRPRSHALRGSAVRPLHDRLPLVPALRVGMRRDQYPMSQRCSLPLSFPRSAWEPSKISSGSISSRSHAPRGNAKDLFIVGCYCFPLVPTLRVGMRKISSLLAVIVPTRSHAPRGNPARSLRGRFPLVSMLRVGTQQDLFGVDFHSFPCSAWERSEISSRSIVVIIYEKEFTKCRRVSNAVLLMRLPSTLIRRFSITSNNIGL
jgi:hypothetical protein